jgi:membrane protein YqaA with SNARE-associated domain
MADVQETLVDRDSIDGRGGPKIHYSSLRPSRFKGCVPHGEKFLWESIPQPPETKTACDGRILGIAAASTPIALTNGGFFQPKNIMPRDRDAAEQCNLGCGLISGCRPIVISLFMRLFYPLIHFLSHIGYFGPLLMGILDSSFLVLPFGNDFLIVGMVARHPHGAAWYVLSGASGSTAGAWLLAAVSKKLGEERIRKIFGKSRYGRLTKRLDRRSGFAVALAGLAPPPFPFTVVIAGVAALGYPMWRILVINFLSRCVRFTILSFLALKFGRNILGIAKSAPFEWSMAAFIAFCLVASGFSIAHWLRKPPAPSQARA